MGELTWARRHGHGRARPLVRRAVGTVVVLSCVVGCSSSDNGLSADRADRPASSAAPTEPTDEAGSAKPTIAVPPSAETDRSDPADGSLPAVDVAGPPTVEDVTTALTRAYDAFDPEDADAALARAAAAEREVELAIATQEGVDEELGGPDATEAAFAALDAQFAPLADDLAKPVVLGLRAAPDPSGRVIEGIVGGVLVVGLGAKGAVSATNDGMTGSASLAEGVTVSADADGVVLDVDVANTSEGLTSRLKTRAEVNPCPDADGTLRLQATVDVSSTTAGGSGQTAILDVDVTVQLNDDAQVSGTDDDFRLRRSGLSGFSFWDVSVRGGVGTSDVVVNDFNWFTSKIEDRDATITLAAVLGQLVKYFLMNAAAAGYESGRCIDLQVSASPGPSGLDPLARSTLSAKPRSRRDGLPAGGTVTARLVGGEESVEPSETKVEADATFTFTAPDDVDRTGTVAFESRSKRGVGKAELTLDTKAECIVGTWTLDNATLSAILNPIGQGAGATSFVATGGPMLATFAADGTTTAALNGLTFFTEVPDGTMTAVYDGTDTGRWARNDDGTYTITELTPGATADLTVTGAGITYRIPVSYTPVLKAAIPMSCDGDALTVTTDNGPVTFTRVR